MFILMLHAAYDGMVTLVAFSDEEEAMRVFAKWEQGVPTGIEAVDNRSMRCGKYVDGTVYNATSASVNGSSVLREF